MSGESFDRRRVGLPEEAVALIGEENYLMAQLETVKELLNRAKWARSRNERVGLLMTAYAIIRDCLKIMRVNIEEKSEVG